MNRFIKTAVLALVIFIGGWFLYHRQRIRTPDDVIALINENFAFLTSYGNSDDFDGPSDLPRVSVIPRTPETIRIATFKLNIETIASLTPQKYGIVTDACRQFDLVAVQELSPTDPELPAKLMSAINAGGLKFKMVIEPPQPGIGKKKLFGFIYNSQTIVLDNSHTYQVNDPDRLMTRDPMVGWFRTVTNNPAQAFTFSVVLDSRRSNSTSKRSRV